jgi:hypothetical protein
MANRSHKIIDDPLDLAIKAGVARAIAEHKRAGRSIAISRNGKVVIVPPEEIRVLPNHKSREKRSAK